MKIEDTINVKPIPFYTSIIAFKRIFPAARMTEFQFSQVKKISTHTHIQHTKQNFNAHFSRLLSDFSFCVYTNTRALTQKSAESAQVFDMRRGEKQFALCILRVPRSL